MFPPPDTRFPTPATYLMPWILPPDPDLVLLTFSIANTPVSIAAVMTADPVFHMAPDPVSGFPTPAPGTVPIPRAPDTDGNNGAPTPPPIC